MYEIVIYVNTTANKLLGPGVSGKKRKKKKKQKKKKLNVAEHFLQYRYISDQGLRHTNILIP